jgi:hypothetical protein
MLEFSLPSALVALSWLPCLPPASWLSVPFAAAIFFSKSVPVSLLFLLTLQVIGFLQSTRGSRRADHPLVQKHHFISVAGIFLAIFGASLGDHPQAKILIFGGLILTIPTGAHLFFFSRFYERQTLASFLGSVIIPALSGIEILLKIRAEMKAESGQLWDVGLSVVGLFTYLYGSLMAVLRLRMKSSIIHLALAQIGLALFILVIDHETLGRTTLWALSVAAIGGAALLSLGDQMGERFGAFSRVAVVALPGMAGFTAYFYSMKMAISMNPVWIAALLAGYLLQVITLVAIPGYGFSSPERITRIRFWMVVLVQVAAGVGFFLLGGVK